MSSILTPQQVLIQNLIEEGQRKFSEELLVEFLLSKIYIRSENKIQKYSFAGHACLKEVALILQKAKDFCALKCGQFGVSTLLLAESFYRADRFPFKLSWFFQIKTT